MSKKLFYILISVVFIQSCSYFKSNKDQNKTVIAKVNEVFLYKEDILSILPKEYTKSDSILLVSSHINSWAKQQLLYSKAKINLKDDQEEIKNLVDKYQQDLLISKYKEAVITQELDTIIIASDIDKFYNENKEIFKLNEKLIKFKFIQVSNDITNIKKIQKLFKSNKERDLIILKKKELEYKFCHLNDSVWIKYRDVLKLLPIVKSIEKKIYKNSYIKKQDSADLYLIKINKVLNRNQLAPKSYAKPRIKQMILHSRKLLLLKNIEKTLLNDATKNGKYKIYK